MTDFFRKLNTLISSQINDVLRPIASDEGDSGRRRVARRQVRQGLSKDVEVLRRRIDDAHEYQQTLQVRIERLRQEVARWDVAADQAVAEGRELDARFALERLQKAQRDLEQAENDLRQHQQVTDELVSKVNYLDYVVHQDDEEPAASASAQTPARAVPAAPAQSSATPPVHVLGQAPRRPDAPVRPTEAPADKARRVSVRVEVEAAEEAAAAAPQQEPPAAAEAAPSTQEKAIRKRRSRHAQVGDAEYAQGVALAKDITQKLDQTREKLAQLTQEANAPIPRDVVDEVKAVVDKAAVDDELSRRISRLSKPPASEPPPS